MKCYFFQNVHSKIVGLVDAQTSPHTADQPFTEGYTPYNKILIEASLAHWGTSQVTLDLVTVTHVAWQDVAIYNHE